MPAIALSETVAYYLVRDIVCFVYLRETMGALGLKSTVISFLRSFLLAFFMHCRGTSSLTAGNHRLLNGSIPNALIYLRGGLLALIATSSVHVLKLSGHPWFPLLSRKSGTTLQTKRPQSFLPATMEAAP